MENSTSSQVNRGQRGKKGQLLQPQPISYKKYYIGATIFILGVVTVIILMVIGIIPNPISNNSTANNSVNCDGDWEPCSPSCGNGTMKYKIKTNKQGNGTSCPENDGASKSCKIKDCPVNCVGEWEPCSAICGSGTETYRVRTIKKGDGTDCPHVTGFSRTCKIKDCPIIKRYPPGPLTASSTTLANYAYGNGLYTSSASTIYPGGLEIDWKAFNHDSTTSTEIWTASSSYHLGNPGTSTTVISGTTYTGDWLQIQLPTPIILKNYNIYTRSDDLNRGPKDFYIGGSNDGSIWFNVDFHTNITSYTISGKSFVISSNNISYSYYRIVVPANNGSWLSICEWELYGHEPL
jgi:hypothetical protein